jgi:hypothetical protein
MDPISIQFLIAAFSIALGLAGLLLPDKHNILKVKGDYARHMSEKDNVRLARMFGAMFIALGVLIGAGTMAFGDLELF